MKRTASLIRRCYRCEGRFPVNEENFYRKSNGALGFGYICKPCHRRDAAVDRTTGYRKYDAARTHESDIKSKYGVSRDLYAEMLVEQDGKCGICGLPRERATKTAKRLSVDHDHETNKIRGLLCVKCNAGIGLLGDDPDRLDEAAYYVRKHRLRHIINNPVTSVVPTVSEPITAGEK